MSNEGLNPFGWLGDQPQDVEEAEADNKKAIEKQQVEIMEFANLVNRVLGESEGLELMQRLRELTIEIPLYRVGGTLVEGDVNLSPAEWCAVREGQNSIVRFLEGQIHLARNPINQEMTDEDT